MEGFLYKKGRGDSAFGRRNWKQRWFVLDGQYLTYFEGFDTKTNKPVNKKGTFLLKGVDVKVTDHRERKHSFAITNDDSSPMFLQADNETLCKLWMSSIKNASMGIYGLSKKTDFREYYMKLGLSYLEDISIPALSKHFRKLCLKCHPDKGGDPKEVCNYLQNVLYVIALYASDVYILE